MEAEKGLCETQANSRGPTDLSMAKKNKSAVPTESTPIEKNAWYKDPVFLIILVLTVTGVIIYAQTVRFDFINLDDNIYVTENPMVHTGLNWESIKWAFTSA